MPDRGFGGYEADRLYAGAVSPESGVATVGQSARMRSIRIDHAAVLACRSGVEDLMRQGTTRIGMFANKTVWFADRPKINDCLRLTNYHHTQCRGTQLGFVRNVRRTKVIDLTKEEEELLRDCGRSTVYKIKRAQREGVTALIVSDADAFMRFYNEMANDAKRAALKPERIRQYGSAIKFTSANWQRQILVMHSYLCDSDQGRVRLLHSVSLVWAMSSSNDQRSRVSRANRLLHYEDMLYFKKCGFKLYDMGGYAIHPTDSKLVGINHFKDGFGGTLIEESDYVSYSLFAARYVRRVWRGLWRQVGRSSAIGGDAECMPTDHLS